MSDTSTPTSNQADTRNLATRIAAAIIELDGLFRKDGENTFHRYKYVTADQVAELAHQALARNGVVVSPNIQSIIYARDVTGEKRMNDDTMQTTYCFTATLTMAMHVMCATGEQTVEPWGGMGTDSSDPSKAFTKAISTGVKYYEMKLVGAAPIDEPKDGEHETKQAEKDARGAITQQQGRGQVPAAKQQQAKQNAAPRVVAGATGKLTSAYFYAQCFRAMNVTIEQCEEALDGEPLLTWLKGKPGRTPQEAMNVIYEYSKHSKPTAKPAAN